MNFGFSYVGVIYLLMLFIPNGFWVKYPPEGYRKISGNENKILGFLERAIEAGANIIRLGSCLFGARNYNKN